MVKNLPAMWGTQIRSLGQEDPLENEMATHFSILLWRIPWTEELGSYSPWSHKDLDTTELLTHTNQSCLCNEACIFRWVSVSLWVGGHMEVLGE